MSAQPAVMAEHLTKRFGEFVAVDDIDLTVATGEIFGFLGPNGAGKSTTIRMLCGLMRPTAGRAEVLGLDVARNPEAIRERIGYMAQRSAMYNDLTVSELLHFYGRIYGLPEGERRRKVDGWIERAGLVGRERQLVGTLSGGWRQRLALGCAILHRPTLMLLDEPTSGTDPVQRREFWELIYRFADEGTTVLVTTHYMDEAEHCDVLAFIHDGRIISQGFPQTIKRTAMRGGLLEIVADPWMAAMQALREVPEVRDAALYGVAIHAVADDPLAAAPRVRRVLEDRGIAVRRIEQRLPTLEDVFVSLTGRALDGGASGSDAVRGGTG